MTETTNGPAWMKVLGAFLLLSFGGMVALTVFLTSEIGVGPATLLMLPSVLVLAAGIVLVTASIRVDIADDVQLRFFPVWRRRLEYSELDSVRVDDQPWFRFGGVGLRWRGDATGLILGNRPAVVLRTRRNHEYVVQCSGPERVAEHIRDRLGRR
ncbi:hypothetical protein [Curtobacterium sp. MCBD17_030]|uniref:hypothetical protein n=1 Tax=Curtobacterium sp. MCBD17_030 TaxID=2175649 RepID=UPI000D914497|nr:hypothetical protein [Curtobacterium sp. MCBD17_030]PYY32400.1 hypothetical protein DEI89_13300 [Curtobacterium sp. MCBD17_030]